MARALHEDIARAFRSADPDAARDALAWAANRAAELMAEANRQKLTDFWKKLAAVHHQTQRLDLTPELREQRGYLHALVQLCRAVRDQSDDLEAIQQVKSNAHGPKILRLLRKAGTMSHGELADALDIRPPTLTQAIRALADSRTITATVHGKFKYYSLTPLGTLVARRLETDMTLQDWVATMASLINAGASPEADEAELLEHWRGSRLRRERTKLTVSPPLRVLSGGEEEALWPAWGRKTVVPWTRQAFPAASDRR